jgi:hypothetical protein
LEISKNFPQPSQYQRQKVTGKGIVCAVHERKTLLMLENGKLVWAEEQLFATPYTHINDDTPVIPQLRELMYYFYFANNPEKIYYAM